MPNPYDASNPADPVKAFAGRANELRRIRSCFESSREGHIKNVFVEGEWGIGKTSLLFKLRPEFQEQGPVINEILADGPDQAAWFYSAVFSELLEARPGGVTAEQIQDVDVHDQRRIRKLLKSIWDGLHDRYGLVVIMLDELERADPDFLLGIRDVFQRLAQDGAHYMLVFAGRRLPTRGTEAADPVGRFFNPRVVLESFDEAASLEAIGKPVRFGPFSFTEDAARMIHERATGHPYFLKFICSEVFEAAEGKGEIDVPRLEKLWPDVEEKLAGAKFGKEFGKLPDGEQTTLLHASRLGQRFERNELQGAIKKSLDTFLNRLLERKLIRSVSRGVYELYHPLFRTYLQSVAEERKLPATTTIAVPGGRRVYGREQLEDCIAKAARRRLDIIDQHFRGRAVSMLEAAKPGVQVRVLMGEDPEWPKTKRLLRDLDEKLRRRVQVRAWPDKSQSKVVPFHFRCLIGDLEVWKFDHSLDGAGKKKAYLTDDTANRKQHAQDFESWWKESEQIFPEK